MDAAGEELADRVRALLTLGGDVEEKRMFGTRAFLIDGHILVGARSAGVLLVRVREETGAALVARPGVTTAVMGPRTMGTGWLDVAPEATADDEALAFWLDVARGDADRQE
ncbi:TfoX/Sxy family protein [Microbacterium hydrocarbonoxydans]|uniref:TfoX/Sxy family protein n=1 Tax=Microbacterium hydrocarbonoxydans TaxID=273678 RepID=UPI002040FC5F|nr:TfoX/Sxy family protein [Microbacterium hydrocarbonoxydans]MCM3780999.1 TfoX/Sxy family protein [Microbacterium hydrocarbonoxydans]